MLWVRHVFLAPSRRRYGAWLFWQFSQDGRIDGIARPVDLNVFRGSAAEFERLFPRVEELP
jgi:lysozyme